MKRIDAMVKSVMRAARIPGAAIAVVRKGEIAYAHGYGVRDIQNGAPMTGSTRYPIASTSKGFNATLLAMLVEEGRLAWDVPVRNYLPGFALADPVASAQTTLRDLVTMRTGLPRHDWVWIDNPISRAELVSRMAHLPVNAGLREQFQYCNLTVAAAGHVAELVTGKGWEALIWERVLAPLGMSSTSASLAANDESTSTYHENTRRELLLTTRRACETIAPAGGALISTIEDMARWVLFNLGADERLRELHMPQIAVGSDPSAPTPNASYAMGWYVDFYNGHRRTGHGGYLHDVSTDVSLFPDDGLGFVSFTNFGCSIPARLINEHAFDALMGLAPMQSVEDKLRQYEEKVASTAKRHADAPRVNGTRPSHPLDGHEGTYEHPGYGAFHVVCSGERLILRRNQVELPLRHWHYDEWVATDIEAFSIAAPHAFDASNAMLFESNADGEIAALLRQLEPAVPPLRFTKSGVAA